jgi:hypothetical protein
MGRFLRNTQMSNFEKIRSKVAAFFHADRRTDMTKLILPFRNIANSSNDSQSVEACIIIIIIIIIIITIIITLHLWQTHAKHFCHWKDNKIYAVIDSSIFKSSLFAQRLNSRSPKLKSAVITFKENACKFVTTAFSNFWRDADICLKLWK